MRHFCINIRRSRISLTCTDCTNQIIQGADELIHLICPDSWRLTSASCGPNSNSRKEGRNAVTFQQIIAFSRRPSKNRRQLKKIDRSSASKGNQNKVCAAAATLIYSFCYISNCILLID